MGKIILFGKRLPSIDAQKISPEPDWKQCDPAFIRKALRHALQRPSGGWYVVDDAVAIGTQPKSYEIDGRELVAFRCNGRIVIGQNSCPHLGGPLAGGRIRDGKLVCPWHGLEIDPETGHDHWQAFPVYDDGLLVWVQMGSKDEATPKPILAPRPDPNRSIAAIIRREAACEPDDVIANRLDPWHGHHYHPHTFASLVVTDVSIERLTLRVAYRVLGPFCVEVDATFHSPEPRTIVMTIVAGEGLGSLVETHATPIAPGRSVVTEATIATSERPEFRFALKMGSLIRPLMKKAAHRLWLEDAAYTERAYALRTKSRRSRKDRA
ncbi:MAG: DUF5914 domain-containing protein [Candidatus Lernaella stagnicola]|nr:DUF5914 domain-containing protein [Candidatus Lernaella stagnicola]